MVKPMGSMSTARQTRVSLCSLGLCVCVLTCKGERGRESACRRSGTQKEDEREEGANVAQVVWGTPWVKRKANENENEKEQEKEREGATLPPCRAAEEEDQKKKKECTGGLMLGVPVESRQWSPQKVCIRSHVNLSRAVEREGGSEKGRRTLVSIRVL